MNNLIAWVVSPRLIDFILAFIVLEGLGLMVWLRGEHPALRRSGIGFMLTPGALLMLALRAALAGVAWPWVPAFLGAALIAHLLDLRERLRG